MDFDKIFYGFDFKGSFLDELFKHMEQNLFIDLVDGVEPAVDEEEIGKLDKLEKALGNMIYEYTMTVRILNKRLEEQKDRLSKEERKQICLLLNCLARRYRIAVDWVESSMEEHFGAKAKPDTLCIETRSEFRVVLVSRKKRKREGYVEDLGELALATYAKYFLEN